MYWPLDDQFYPSTVGTINEDENTYHIDHENGDIDTLDLSQYTFILSDDGAMNVNKSSLSTNNLRSGQ